MIEAQTRYRVTGMDCASCATKIEAAARRVEGVQDVGVSVGAGTMVVRHHDRTDLARLEKAVRGLGYGILADRQASKPDAQAKHGHEHRHTEEQHSHSSEDAEGPWWKTAKGLLTIASGAGLVSAYGLGQAVPGVEAWAFIAAMLIGLVPIARRAVMAALNGTVFTIELLMAIAAVGAVIIGATEEAATVVFLFLVGELLEGVAAGRARAGIRNLTALVPKTALVERDGRTDEVAADQLEVGSTVLVRPGERIAADGQIVDGESVVNEAPVSGESTPVRKRTGDNVFAGTISTDGVLRVKVTAAAADNTIARIVRLVEEAQESKAPTERFIDRFSRYYTPGVLALGTLVAITPPLLWGADPSEWVYKGLAILLIGCPCALVISTPAAIAAALSAGARRGLLIKGGAVLEGLGSITAMALDKTGTLTEGRPKVTDVIPLGRSERDVLSIAAALETGSTHPLALAILDKAKAAKVPVPPASDSSAIGGKGVIGKVGGKVAFLGSAAAAEERVKLEDGQRRRLDALNDEGKSASILVVEEQLAGIIAMRDEPRPDAKEGLDALRASGIETIMLTGDNRRTAEAVGRALGLPVKSEMLPQDKQRVVRELQAQGKKVAKVGDGINDAPALAAAEIGIAMGGGTDVALETADAAVLHGRVRDLADMVELSRRTMANIHRNLTIALGLKAVFLVTTVIGVTGLWPAILADTGATVLVTANAMRLLGWRGSRSAEAT